MLTLLASHRHRIYRESCVVNGPQIVVRFFDDPVGPESIIDKAAIVQAGTIDGGEWRFVVDTDQNPPLRLSPFRPNARRLVIDTRHQLAAIWSKRTGKARIVPAFPKPGRYTSVFSDNLGTEIGNMADWECRVCVGQAARSGAAPARVEGAAARR